MACMGAIPLQRDDVEYPESDGKPLGETGIHVEETLGMLGALLVHFDGTPDVYAGSNMFMYYVPGDWQQSVCPDVFVVKGVPSRPPRRTFKIWEEGRPPCLIVEVTSRSTRNEDLIYKKALYERLGVEDYILHDTLGEYLRPPLQGFHLVDGLYQRLEPAVDGSLPIRSLGMTATSEGIRLRLRVAATRKPLLYPDELGKAAHQFEKEARRASEDARRAYEEVRREAERRHAAEEELARLRMEIERLRGQS